MFSLHIDTARTWRGGQNQALLTVNGLRSAGHRAALVAHPDGELRRRAAEGLELIPLAPRTEVDLSAGWKLSRVIRRLEPDVIHAHDPHGVAMAALALSLGGRGPAPPLIASRRVDFHLKGNSFSRWKHRQVDCFIAASEAIRQMLLDDGIPVVAPAGEDAVPALGDPEEVVADGARRPGVQACAQLRAVSIEGERADRADRLVTRLDRLGAVEEDGHGAVAELFDDAAPAAADHRFGDTVDLREQSQHLIVTRAEGPGGEADEVGEKNRRGHGGAVPAGTT